MYYDKVCRTALTLNTVESNIMNGAPARPLRCAVTVDLTLYRLFQSLQDAVVQ